MISSQLQVFVVHLGQFHNDLNKFKLTLRDFLIQLKEFSGDNAELFLEEKVMAITKMTSANLALVMAPNLLRCNSESMAVVFTNAQYVLLLFPCIQDETDGLDRYEQTFVHNLLLHLNCETIDPDYVPKHGLGAVTATTQPRTSKSRSRRPTHS